jgi:hypothetical protein
MLSKKELLKWYNGHFGIEIIETNDNKAFACDKWNGEYWSDCWQLDDKYNVVNPCEIRPIYKERKPDQFDIIDYEVTAK